MSYYIGKTTYQHPDENGRMKTKNDHYIIDALSFTEAEARMAAMASNLVTPTVTAIRPVKISEIIESDEGDIWYEAKVIFYTIDDRTGKDKKFVNTIFLNHVSLTEAVAQLSKVLAGSLIACAIESIKATPIQEYLPYYPTETPATTPEQ